MAKRKKISFDEPIIDPFDAVLRKVFFYCETRDTKREKYTKRVNATVCKARSAGEFKQRGMDIQVLGSSYVDECLGCTKWIDVVDELTPKQKLKKRTKVKF